MSLDILNDHISLYLLGGGDTPTLPHRDADVSIHKPTLSSSNIRQLLRFLALQKWKVVPAIVCLILTSAVTLPVPFIACYVLERLYHNYNSEIEIIFSWSALSMASSLSFLAALINYIRVVNLSMCNNHVAQSIKSTLFGEILKQEQAFFDKKATGDLLNRLNRDTHIVAHALTYNVADGFRSIVTFFGGIVIMIYISPLLSLACFAFVGVFSTVIIAAGRIIRYKSKNFQRRQLAAAELAEEKLSKIRTIKIFGTELKENETYKTYLTTIAYAGDEESKIKAVFLAMVGLVGNILLIIVICLVHKALRTKEYTPSVSVGGVSAFLIYAVYLGLSMGGLTNFYTELIRALCSSERIFQIINRRSLTYMRDADFVGSVQGRLLFEIRSFSYSPMSVLPVLENVIFEVAPGKIVAIVGPSGSGKSTLASLLLGLYQLQNGQIMLDNYNIYALEEEILKKNVTVVTQNPKLFNMTLKDNILYGVENPNRISNEEFMQAATAANVAEFAQHLPNGYETMLGHREHSLTESQSQRVAIARALILNPKVLIFDETTTVLDPVSEELVHTALTRAMRGRTVLLLAHRLSTIQCANEVVVMQRGTIVEKGTYEFLSGNASSHFRQLESMQYYVKLRRKHSMTKWQKMLLNSCSSNG